jgi:hypothetical protein
VNVCGARVELKCHVKCWELGWGMGGIYVNSKWIHISANGAKSN